MAAIATVDGWTERAAELDVPRQAFIDGGTRTRTTARRSRA